MENLEEISEDNKNQKEISIKVEKACKKVRRVDSKFLKESTPIKKQIAELRRLLEEKKSKYVSDKKKICEKDNVSYTHIESILFSHVKKDKASFSFEEVQNSREKGYLEGVEDAKKTFRLRSSDNVLSVVSDFCQKK